MSVYIPGTSAALRYDTALCRCRKGRLPAGFPVPQPTSCWPAENVALLERYRLWLEGSGDSQNCIGQLYIPMAGHVLGLALKPHHELDLEADLAPALDFVQVRQPSAQWAKNCRHALARFRLFLSQERGQVEAAFRPVSVERYQAGLPAWLVEQLTRYQHIRQANWRPARLVPAILRFWSSHSRLWRWLFEHHPVRELGNIRCRQIYDYIDHRLAAGYSPKGVNQELRAFQATLRYLEEQEYHVPQALLRLQGLKEGEALPRFLTDEQVSLLRADLEGRVEVARTLAQRRNALFDRAAFYLLWQAGLRLGEAEELCLADLDLAARKLIVRQGKGMKDRAVYLTHTAVGAVVAYLAVRGPTPTDYLFIYHHRPVKKDLIRARIKAAGERVGMAVTPHCLRHTFATQLVNAGCRVTTIQMLLGHKRLNSTMIYARVHDRTVAEDYFTAMEAIEQRLEMRLPVCQPAAMSETGQDGNQNGSGHLLALVDALDSELLDRRQRELVAELRGSILALAV
jgi:site-specific recombinase XerD